MDKLKSNRRLWNCIIYLLIAMVGCIAVVCLIRELRSDNQATMPFDMDSDESIVQSLEQVEEIYYPQGIYVEVGSNNSHPIQMFQRDKQCYFLLPSYATEADLFLYYKDDYKLSINGEHLDNGAAISGVVWGKTNALVIEQEDKTYEYELVFQHSENIPAVFVDTKSGNMEHIYEEKGNEEPGNVTILLQDGTENYSGSIEKIKGRGNYSWSRSKKSFVMTLENASDLLNMGEAYKWILLANVDDGSYMRNKITFDVARELGIEYVTDAEFIDLYLNGEYAGNYYLCEKIEVAPERVQMQEGSTQNYMIELDNYLGEDSTFISDSGVKVSIHYPEDVTKEQNIEIAQLFQRIENAVLAEDGIDPVTGKYYTELIDVDGLTKRYLIDEMGKLDDGWDGSSYWFTRNDGKLYAGPVWDYELSLGNVPSWFAGDENPQGLREIKISNWYAALYQKEDFYENMVETYNLQMVPILNTMLETRIDEYAEEIEASAQMDRVIYQGENFYLPYESLDGQVKALKSFIQKRMEFLDEVWNQGIIYHEVRLESEGSGVVTYYYVKDGECLNTLLYPSKDDSSFAGWYYQNGQKFSPFYPVYEDMTIIGKWNEENE